MSLVIKGRGALSRALVAAQPTNSEEGSTLLHALDPTPGARKRAALEDELAEVRVSLEACRREGRPFILGSHDDVFGKATGPSLDEESAVVLDPADCDAAVIALMAEQLAFAYRAEYGIRATVLRFFGLLGADMSPNAPVAKWIDAVARGATLSTLTEAPIGCVTDAEDAVQAVSAALNCEETDGQIVHVADARPIPWQDWAVAIQRLASPLEIGDPQPWPAVRYAEAARARNIMGFTCSADRARGVEQYVRQRLRR